ncbi:hypothetical protein PR003_g8164 [Phytophthora rubi]|uniref:Uncharacterized protein n=1 Tax=Phytophthora rubi TaxID=129364 RepID=A0A6A3NNU2_9STRA|nr:hypothetical protein PR002_g6284 [Phytophthora rubi]KAE9042695.1 hypothetical protein PR001_g6084 [Phytophthora rubi]KAE9345016.1 hypothetical protein PR003_g8164 [Phytophthora rubi]
MATTCPNFPLVSSVLRAVLTVQAIPPQPSATSRPGLSSCCMPSPLRLRFGYQDRCPTESWCAT